jgi:hypothetical protein
MYYDNLYINYRIKTCRGTTKKGARCKKDTKGNFCKLHMPDINISIEIPKECAICLDDINVADSCIECGHLFHKKCLIKMENNKCPLCRKESNIVALYLERIKNRITKIIDKLFYTDIITDFIIGINNWVPNFNTKFLSHIVVLKNFPLCSEIIHREMNNDKSDEEILHIINDELKDEFLVKNYTSLILTSMQYY